MRRWRSWKRNQRDRPRVCIVSFLGQGKWRAKSERWRWQMNEIQAKAPCNEGESERNKWNRRRRFNLFPVITLKILLHPKFIPRLFAWSLMELRRIEVGVLKPIAAMAFSGCNFFCKWSGMTLSDQPDAAIFATLLQDTLKGVKRIYVQQVQDQLSSGKGHVSRNHVLMTMRCVSSILLHPFPHTFCTSFASTSFTNTFQTSAPLPLTDLLCSDTLRIS